MSRAITPRRTHLQSTPVEEGNRPKLGSRAKAPSREAAARTGRQAPGFDEAPAYLCERAGTRLPVPAGPCSGWPLFQRRNGGRRRVSCSCCSPLPSSPNHLGLCPPAPSTARIPNAIRLVHCGGLLSGALKVSPGILRRTPVRGPAIRPLCSIASGPAPPLHWMQAEALSPSPCLASPPPPALAGPPSLCVSGQAPSSSWPVSPQSSPRLLRPRGRSPSHCLWPLAAQESACKGRTKGAGTRA